MVLVYTYTTLNLGVNECEEYLSSISTFILLIFFNLKIKHFPSVLVPHDTILNCSFLQELIQNAEDANARRVKFLHDKNSYGTEHLFDEELAQFQVKQRHGS